MRAHGDLPCRPHRSRSRRPSSSSRVHPSVRRVDAHSKIPREYTARRQTHTAFLRHACSPPSNHHRDYSNTIRHFPAPPPPTGASAFRGSSAPRANPPVVSAGARRGSSARPKHPSAVLSSRLGGWSRFAGGRPSLNHTGSSSSSSPAVAGGGLGRRMKPPPWDAAGRLRRGGAPRVEEGGWCGAGADGCWRPRRSLRGGEIGGGGKTRPTHKRPPDPPLGKNMTSFRHNRLGS